MIIGCLKEIKIRENRVALIPGSARALISAGHTVLIQESAGIGCGIPDEAYRAVGAKIVSAAEQIWKDSDMIVKVKEPLPEEYGLIKPGQILFIFLHLAAEPELTRVLLEKQVTGVAMETIQVGNTLPILKPMSAVAGRMAVQVGAWCLEKHQGGKGMLLGGVTGVPRAKVAIIGGGVAGSNAAKIAVGIGADVTILDTNMSVLEYLDDVFSGSIKTLYSNPHNVAESVLEADLVIGAVLVAGARAPKLVTKDLVSNMSEGSVIVDIAIDQGGCVETMHRTTHDDPIFVVNGVIHYGVANMPGAVPRTSTYALAHATLPFMRQLADRGVAGIKDNQPLALGVNTYKGYITHHAVAQAYGTAKYVELSALL